MENPFGTPAASGLVKECAALAEDAQARLVGLQAEVSLDDYSQMRRMRTMEETLSRHSKQGGHLGIGQEAVALGTTGSLAVSDYVTATYRGHLHSVAKGIEPRRVIAEFLGRVDGTSGGRGGSMLSFDPAVNMVATSGIVGGAVPLALGAALTAHRTGNGAVALTAFGDGAMAQGAVHESLNIAALWRLPLVFVCENNEYSEMTRTEQTSAVTPLAWRAVGHGVPAVTVDGSDLAAVRAAAQAAIERARSGAGPAFVEALTYRFSGHYIGDPEHYRPAAEVAERRQRDPLLLTRNNLIQAGIPADRIDEADREVTEDIKDAEQFALNSALPSPDTLFDKILKA
jgi:TPP-dependent pyruvate/acetoin dehydrogenase alpha subunit